MRFDVLTLHPEMVRVPLSSSILGRATERGAMELEVHDMREHGLGRHRSVDDTPYGGGAGMVLRVDVVVAALEGLARAGGHRLLMSPQGPRFQQSTAQRLAQHDHLVFVCGHYEGVDARIESYVDEAVSLGDFVVTGGEIAAVAMIDAIARLVPGVLGNASSAVEESFASGLLEYPQYTRPRTFRGDDVPDVLVSGHHGRIEQWRRVQSERRTAQRRPDLWAQHQAVTERLTGAGSEE